MKLFTKIKMGNTTICGQCNQTKINRSKLVEKAKYNDKI